MLRVFFLHLRSAAKNRSAMFLPIPNREDLIPELTRIAEGAMEDHFADDVLDRAEEYYGEALWELAEARPGRSPGRRKPALPGEPDQRSGRPALGVLLPLRGKL